MKIPGEKTFQCGSGEMGVMYSVKCWCGLPILWVGDDIWSHYGNISEDGTAHTARPIEREETI